MKILVTTCLSSLLAFAGFAQRETFGVLSFETIQGWRTDISAGHHYAFVTEDLKGFCKVILYPERSGSADVRKEFDLEWSDLIKKNLHVDYLFQPFMGSAEDGWTPITSATWVKPPGQTPYLAQVVSVVGHDRVTSVVVFMSDTARFMNTFQQFLRSVKPLPTAVSSAPTQNSSPAGSSEAGTITGMWMGLGNLTLVGGITNASGTGYSMFGTSSTLRRQTIVFYPDGTFCGVIPTDGFHTPHAQMREKFPNYWGTYNYAGGSGTIELAGRSYPFSLSGTTLKYGGVDFMFHLKSMDGAHFEGTFTCERDPQKYLSQVKAEPEINFTADGHFRDQGALYWIRHVRGYTEDMSDNNFGSGTYSISDFTMTFHYEDGRKIDITFIDASGPDPVRPTQVRFGPVLLDRK